MAEGKSGDERMAVVETTLQTHVLPMLQKMDGKLDNIMAEKASKESVKEAHEAIDELRKALDTKADKAEFDKVKEKVLIYTGGIGVIVVLASWLGPKLLTLLAK